jgi:hypothetical protein
MRPLWAISAIAPPGLFEDTATHPLQLVHQETFETGVLNLTYAPAT